MLQCSCSMSGDCVASYVDFVKNLLNFSATNCSQITYKLPSRSWGKKREKCDESLFDSFVIITCILSFLPVSSALCSCYNCGGLDHHAKECGLPPQPKKCHYCQSITHMVAQCPHKALAPATGSQDQHASTSAFSPGTGPYLCPPEEEERSGSSPLEGSSSSPEEPHTRGPRTQRWRKS